jgi:hypothetical protein
MQKQGLPIIKLKDKRYAPKNNTYPGKPGTGAGPAQKPAGRRIEIIAFAIEEDTPAEDTKTASMADFFGTVSPENAESLHQHAKQARNEWDREF